ncbi:probable LRR receptor-like protein kinase At1g51890 [Raphanus sativus]|uniref:non-specific serine/threonine protein kinase n=1 Tax=Raphanus sativus TaxID=3726 RepID=A0A6J0JJE7_RAPSA|nr:probable LRR receptor-like protein kinase At1g51890 [Raphanus sativus]
MKFLFWFLPFLIRAFDILELVQAQDQSGFISLDCGLVPKETNYVEKSTNITYRSDFNYIETGVTKKINDAYTTQFQQQTWSLRSFPDGQRNCYTFNLTANRKYLIRGTFIYGNYDDLNQLPIFDLYIGPNRWTTVTTLGVTNGSIHEMIHVLTQNRLQVCLVKTGDTTPFISSLELRPLNNETYVTQSGSLVAVSRVFFSPTPTFVRYDEDINDRTWVPYIDKNNSVITTNFAVDTSNFYNVPQVVARTAAIPVDESQPLTIDWTLDEATAQSYIYMHFAEIQNLKANETREFNITYNGGQRWYSNFRPPNFSVTTIFNPRAVSSPDGNFSFTFAMTSNSTLPPLINALEIYKVLDLTLLETDQDEVLAMMNIKVTYELSERPSWQGDPCVPQLYRWEGLDCSYPDSEPPRIISLNLTGSNLTGSITSDISKLTQLKELDLSNNDLSGDIPVFFADMKMLTLINLSGNPKVNGSVIPNSLQQRIDSKSLTLILDGNQIPTVKRKNKDVTAVAIAASVAGGFALLVIVAIIFVVTRRKQKSPEASGPESSVTTGNANTETRSSNPSIMTQERKFTYSEVLKMTNNFARVLGKGGFGTVYHGNLDDTQVAVKMLSHSSAQGYKEFKAEVELLLRVHHRHLVGLVGYCDDGDKLALIYEYMANGDLRENMLGKRSSNVLSWETRMQIAVEAAQGLEYLHNGCRPPMVHRDVKTTNILLNERFQAKLADFGLSRSFPIDGESQVMTVVAGTPGYLDPEYYRTNWLSEKSDVYSFGVVLLEMVTNQPVIDKTRVKPHISDWVGFKLTNGDIRSIIDPKLMDDYDANGVWKVIELALACVNPSSNRRPTMPHVVMELNECLAFEVERKHGSQEMYTKNSTEFSPSTASDFSPVAR